MWTNKRKRCETNNMQNSTEPVKKGGFRDQSWQPGHPDIWKRNSLAASNSGECHASPPGTVSREVQVLIVWMLRIWYDRDTTGRMLLRLQSGVPRFWTHPSVCIQHSGSIMPTVVSHHNWHQLPAAKVRFPVAKLHTETWRLCA